MSEARERSELVSGCTLFCKVDTIAAVRDYPPFTACLRLYGVDKRTFKHPDFEYASTKCKVFTVDVDVRALRRSIATVTPWAKKWYECLESAAIEVERSDTGWLPAGDEADFPRQVWLRINFVPAADTKRADGYYYQTFTEEAPRFFNVLQSEVVLGPSLQAVAQDSSTIDTLYKLNGNTNLRAFHVGQGMCSLLHDESQGVLFDAGVGTPIRRPAYQAGAFANELKERLDQIDQLSMVLSHMDSDHWRLLDWDPAILSRISRIYVPSDVDYLPLKSHRITQTIIPVSKMARISFFGPTGLETIAIAFRSNPRSCLDRDGECLVVFCMIQQQLALIPGDYTYEQLHADKAIGRMYSGLTFDAVMVPYHGDDVSAALVPPPTFHGTSQAFFSAGTHRRLQHPDIRSIAAHADMGFQNIAYPSCTEIRSVHLLPHP